MRHRSDDCYFWPFGNGARRGYPNITIDGKRKSVHRYVCELVNGPPPTPQHAAAHTCGQGLKGCVSPRHLVWKTYSENEADKLIHGTRARGTRNGTAKLSEENVYEIRALQGKMPAYRIAERYGVSERAVMFIHSRKKWGWLPER
jgi:hypothetical protein